MQTDNIYKSAKLLIRQYGLQAEVVAEERMYQLMEEHDVRGAALWLNIMSAINDLNILKNKKYLN